VPAVLRLATTADAPALTAMLARAFEDDPVSVWGNPDPALRPRRIARFFAGRLRTLVPHELAWTTEDRWALALWAPPDAWKAPTRELVRMVPAVSPRRALLVMAGLSGVERAHPHEPHLYLAVLGVDPARQRQGLGSRVLAPGLAMCDREGTPAYLETAKADNVTFYERHGFRVTEERRLPRGPKVWLMWRDPR
jgi:ribosomal protein S18 acetylase RimI-like enzyme